MVVAAAGFAPVVLRRRAGRGGAWWLQVWCGGRRSSAEVVAERSREEGNGVAMVAGDG